MKFQPKHLAQLAVRAAQAWSDDYAPSMGAAISYYTVFSLAPVLVIAIAVAGAVFGREAVQGEIVAQLGGLVGQQGADLVQKLVAAASNTGKGAIAGTVSFLVLLLGATSVFTELQSALDRIWHVPPTQRPSGIRAILRARLASFGLILGLVFLLMVSLVVSTAVSALGSFTGRILPGTEVLLQVVNALVSLGISTLLFAMIYKVLPSTRIEWRDVWVGAFVTAFLFEAGKFLIGLYLGKSSMTQTFAAAGALVILIAWVYYAAQIFLLGAEFTKIYAQEHGSHAAAWVAAEAAVATPKPEVAAPSQEAADRLEETRQKLQAVTPAPPVPGSRKALAGASALAGMVAVAVVRRLLQRRRGPVAG